MNPNDLHKCSPNTAVSGAGTVDSVGLLTCDSDVVDRIIDEWRNTSGSLSLLEFIKARPDITGNRNWIIELALEEFSIQRRLKPTMYVEDYCQEFAELGPSISSSIARQIEVCDVLAEIVAFRGTAQSIAWPTSGQQVDRFLVIEELGRGTFARAYRCLERGVGNRQVVVKIAYQGAFEADILGRLAHSSIVPVYSVNHDETTGVSYVCMPFYGRSTLQDLIDGVFVAGSVPVRGAVVAELAERWKGSNDPTYPQLEIKKELLRFNYVEAVAYIGRQLADALAHAHSEGVVHGDLKPSNVLLSFGGMPMILDFNLSRNSRFPTRLLGGSLPYMAPEQLESVVLKRTNSRSVSSESLDVYSLGAVLYQLLCGHCPYQVSTHCQDAKEAARELLQMQKDGPPLLTALNPSVNESFAGTIQSCLAWDSSDRPATMQELLVDLRRELMFRHRVSHRLRSHRRSFLAISLVGALLASAAIGAYSTLPPYSERQYQQGMQDFQAEEYELAEVHFTAVIDKEHQNADALLYRGRCRLYLDDIPGAVKDFRASAELREDGRSYAFLGYSSNLLGEHGEAIVWYKKAIDKGIVSAQIHNNLGFSYLNHRNAEVKEKRIATAEKCLCAAIEIDDSLCAARYNRALLELERANSDAHYQPQTGLDDIQFVIANEEPSSIAYYHAANLCKDLSGSDPNILNEGMCYLKKAVALSTESERQHLRTSPVVLFYTQGNVQTMDLLLSSPAPSTPTRKVKRFVDPAVL